MFDPFGDFAAAGYLRNHEGLKDLEIIKIQEHVFFEANLPDAIAYLQSIDGPISYQDFLQVHNILFVDFYPWAGQDRHALGVGRLINKGSQIQFEVAELSRRAIEHGLDLGNEIEIMRNRPGEVMGYFAWGHPFLDGNGRTMLLVHTELCARAGIFIDWQASSKGAYLQALSNELAKPGKGILDAYLKPHLREQAFTGHWGEYIQAIPGLDGSSHAKSHIAEQAGDTGAMQRYEEFKIARGEQVP
ncbi:Fic family protein [Undibacterium pigrum]|uniref:protein adenylyltransferase n=1 Tax=Undibacterium pigrum TaxID=401470 RepID=A0A318J1Y2_9BURK|nr:Fic family protein [Undibacterium pigrum]PXX41404.1 cell filamentation protein [Undibacterium pigrum]